MNYKVLLFFLAGCFLVYKVEAQSTDQTLKLYANQYEQERVHIHFDKDAYLPGETIWMKAYLMMGSKPSTLSKNIYFDWTDVNGNLIFHGVAPVIESMATGSFIIPSDLPGGVIHVKAYTQWMLNFDNSFLYNKNIAVLSTWNAGQHQPKPVANIQFFAEGGDLIYGIPSVVAFETTDQHGHPVSSRGVIKKSNGQVVDSFTTVHEGMGSFSFSPAVNEKYTAFWKDEYGESHTTELPRAKSSGAVIRVRPPQNNMIRFQVERPIDGSDNFKSITLIATSHQQVLYKTVVDLSAKTIAEETISNISLPDGMIQLTAFDAHMIPFAERLVFVNNHQCEFTTQLKKEIVNLNKRGRNEISIEIPDSLNTDFSVSVTDAGLGYDTTHNIITDFLLSSDLKGYISNPAYYFSGNSDSINFYLDLLMRTHGWRRFKWEDILAGKLPLIQYPADSGYMELKGQVASNHAPFDASDSIALLVITKDHKKHIVNLPLGSNGSFGQKGIFFYDSVQIVYRLNHASKINANPEVSLHTNLLPAGHDQVSATDPNFEWIKVPDVVLAKESNGLITEINSYSRLSAAMNYVFTPVRNEQEKTNLETVAHYLQNNFPDLKFPYAVKDANTPGGNTDNRYVSYSMTNSSAQSVSPVQRSNVNLLLDGVLVNLDDLKLVTMKEVLFLKFLPKTNAKDLPTLAISSRQSIDQNNIINNKTGFALVTGYTAVKEFYSPQYADNAEDNEMTDFRSTLYWNPHVVADKNHKKVRLVFFNNDISNKFRVVIEGMNKAGKLTRIEEIIK